MTGISVIIPTYNRLRFLEEALYSAQTVGHAQIEIIVVDASAPEVASKVQSICKSRAIYCWAGRSNLSYQRNVGLKIAKGKYVVFLDSDDTLIPDRFSIQIPTLERSMADVCYSRWLCIDSRGLRLREDGEDLSRSLIPLLLYSNIAPLGVFIFRSEAIRAVGGFCTDLRACEDWDLLVRLAMDNRRFEYVPYVTATYRIHELNMSKDRVLMLQSSLHVIKRTFSSTTITSQFTFLEPIAIAMHLAEMLSDLAAKPLSRSITTLVENARRDAERLARRTQIPDLVDTYVWELLAAIREFNGDSCKSTLRTLRKVLNTWGQSMTQQTGLQNMHK